MAPDYNNTFTGSAEALNAGHTTSREIVEASLQRIDDREKELSAFLYIDRDAACRAAEEADSRRNSGQQASSFDGVPVAIKDNISVRGQPCTCGSRILEGYNSVYDAAVIENLRQAGCVILGRTNMDEFAMGSSSEHSAFGDTSNPWDNQRVPGGSSGGSAAAVASGQVPAALGSDTGGSIRQPAAFCGAVGMKPTYGRVSRYGLVAFASSLDQIGPLTMTVQDNAALLDLVAGADKRDATSLPEPSGGYLEKVRQTDPETHLKNKRIGLPREFFETEGLDPEVKEAVDNAATRYRNLGAELVDVSLPYTETAVAAYYIIAPAEASANLARFDGVRYGRRVEPEDGSGLLGLYRQTREAGFGDEVKRRIILGTYVLSSGYYDAYYLRAQKVRTLIRNQFTDVFQHCDALLTPVSPSPPFQKGELTDPLQMYLADIYTISANLAGIPGISMPCGLTTGNLPVGFQLLGPHLSEHELFNMAYCYEQTTETLQSNR